MLPVNRRVLAWFLGLAACLSFLMALAFGLHTWHFRQTAIRALGQVIELRKEMDEGDVTYRAVFRFSDAAGKEHTVTSSMNMKPAAHRVGDRVTVLYPPGNPEAARIDSFWELWFETAIPAVIGVAFAVWFLLTAPRRAVDFRANPSHSAKENP